MTNKSVKIKATLIPFINCNKRDTEYRSLVYLTKEEIEQSKEYIQKHLIPADLPHTTFYTTQEEYEQPPEDEL